MRDQVGSSVRMLEMKSIDEEARLRSRKGEWTCLMTAAVEGHLDICRLLIDKGAQIEAKEGYGMTPLHFADCKPHIDIVRLLCDHGADFEASDCNGWRPLHFAARYGHISVVKELIEVRNAEINARDDHGGTALMYSRYMNKADIAAYLVSHGAIEYDVADAAVADDDDDDDADDADIDADN